MKLANPKAKFKQDHAYIRTMLQHINQLMQLNTPSAWYEIEELYCELSGVCGTLQAYAVENLKTIEEGK